MAATKFYAIYEILLKRIKQGVYQNYLPTEIALTEEFNASRNTIRRAIAVLNDEGIVYSVKGRGVLILEAFKDNNWMFGGSNFNGLRPNMDMSKVDAQTKVLDFKQGNVSIKQAGKIPFSIGEEIYETNRVRFFNGRPMVMDRSFFRVGEVIPLTRAIAEQSIYRYLREQRQKIAAAKRRFSVEPASETDRKYLDLGQNNCVGVLENLVFNDMGKVFEYTQSRFIPADFSLSYYVQNADNLK